MNNGKTQRNNKGYGKKALLLGIEYMKAKYDAKVIYTGVSLDNEVAERLYNTVGFQLTGLVENGMKELKLLLGNCETSLQS